MTDASARGHTPLRGYRNTPRGRAAGALLGPIPLPTALQAEVV